MAKFKGNINNPAPNTVHEPISRSEKIIADNRAEQVRRDTDTQKNFTIGLYDIDETILLQLENLQLQVEDVGKQVKVPIFYGSPERWVSAQKYGYIRDKQGKIILPAMILKRTNTANDDMLPFFNRYLNASVMKLYSEKNKYTKFSTLLNKNIPVNEIYNVVVPDHLVLTYHFIIWTAYVEQMNKLVEAIKFETNDYWGSKKGFKFRVKLDSLGHTVEIQANEDRIVKTEFDITTHGYILPDSMTRMETHEMTTKKMFTAKKLVMGMETVSADYDMSILNKNKEKWRNPIFPNLRSDVIIPGTPVSTDLSIITGMVGIKVDNSPLFLRIVPVPTTQFAQGQPGDMSYDKTYFYIYINTGWKRISISEFITVSEDTIPITGQEGQTSYNDAFFYIYSKNAWRKVAISDANITTYGEEGNVMYDTNYFYIYISGTWRRVAISNLNK